MIPDIAADVCVTVDVWVDVFEPVLLAEDAFVGSFADESLADGSYVFVWVALES